MIDCPKCGGGGELQEPGYSLSPTSAIRVQDPQETITRPCDRCDGEGVIESWPGRCIGCGKFLPRDRDWNQCSDCDTRDPEDY
jgi:hypothetical protein